METRWRTLRSRIAFQHRWYTVRCDTIELPDGQMEEYFVSVRPEVAIVFALTDDQHVLCVRQFKQAAGEVTLELPAGTFEDEAPAVAAARELREETGFVCGELLPLGVFHENTSKNSNRVHVFLGLRARRAGAQELDDTEQGLRVELRTMAELRAGVRDGTITSLSSVVAIYRALDALDQRPA